MTTSDLADLIARKREVLSQLRALGQRQIELTQGSDWSPLAKVLSTKERLLALLLQTEKSLEPFRREESERRVWPSPEAREKCRRDAAVCAELLAEVMSLERQSEQAMIRRRDAAATRLSSLHNSGAAHAAYTAQPTTTHGFDVASER